MSSRSAEIVSVSQVGDRLNITISLSIEDGRISIAFPQVAPLVNEPVVIPFVSPHKSVYDKMEIPDLILLCKQRGLGLNAPRKIDFVNRLCEYDRINTHSTPVLCDITQNESVLARRYSELTWCELFAVCKSRGIKVIATINKKKMIALLEEYDLASGSGNVESAVDTTSNVVDYDSMLNRDLRKLCVEKGFRNTKHLNKQKLIGLLRGDSVESI